MEIAEKLQLNAHIERLIDSGGNDAEARTAVAEFGRAMKAAARFEVEASLTEEGGTAAGQTNELGTVEIKDDKPTTKEFSRGTPKERVGHYTMSRENSRRQDWIRISHFWKAELGSESETELPQQWVLALDQAGQPEWFGERGLRVLFNFHFFRFGVLEVSREIFPQTWGIADVREHKGAFAVKLEVTP